MPIYDYACSACGRVTEVIHGIHDHGPRFCPECGTEGSMRKVLSKPAIVFKGSGWAKVDRRASGRSRTGEAAPKAGAGATAPATSTEQGASKASGPPGSMTERRSGGAASHGTGQASGGTGHASDGGSD